MDQSDFSNPIWGNLIQNKIKVNLNFLAAKILLARYQRTNNVENSTSDFEVARREIFDLYLKNKELPNVKKDIAILLKNKT